MRRQAWALLSLISMLCLGAAACSRYKIATTLRGSNLRTYDGSLKPMDSVGYLSCAASDLDFAEIDGEPIKQLKVRAGRDGGFSYPELLPGEHTVLVKGSTFDTTHRGFHPDLTVDISSYTVSMGGESELTFMVEPGHVYVIKSKITKKETQDAADPAGHILSIYIEDVQTRKIVCRVESDIQK
jgi:hypothetical protein